MVDSSLVSDGLPGILSKNQVEILEVVRGKGHYDLQKLEGRKECPRLERRLWLEKEEWGEGWEMGAEGTFSISGLRWKKGLGGIWAVSEAAQNR